MIILICEHCGSKETKVKGFYFQCKRCGMILCVHCRIPETHNCVCVKYTYGENWTKHELLDYMMKPKELQQRRGSIITQMSCKNTSCPYYFTTQKGTCDIQVVLVFTPKKYNRGNLVFTARSETTGNYQFSVIADTKQEGEHKARCVKIYWERNKKR